MRRKHRRGYQGRFTRLASRSRSLLTLVWTFLAFLSVPGFNGSAHAQSATFESEIKANMNAVAVIEKSLPALESLTLAAGQSSVATTVTAVQDRVDDDAETILITASHGGGMIGAEQTITIIDDDATPAVTTCSGGMAGTYPCSNVDLMSFLALADIGGGDANDIWGWTDSSTGKEYAIMGRTNGTSFVDISDPVNPIYLGNLPPPAGEADERDIKVYADHAFIVTEANDSGMQVFDLTQLRAVASPPATFSETARYSGFSNAHNLAVNEDSGFAYAVGTNTCGGGLHMIDIQTPTNATSAGCFSADGYTHDAQCVNYDGPDLDHQGKEICFNSNLDTLTIVDVTNKAGPAMLSRTGYTGSRDTHQGWLTEDQAYFLLGDESDEANNPNVTNTRTYMWDVSDLDEPALIGSHDSTTTAIDHNQYVKGSYTYQSNYRAGLRILDITDIANGNLTEVAFFDVDPGSDSSNYDDGAWSNYPFFDSGIVIVSVIEQGLFILRPNLVDGVNPALSSASVNGAALTLTYGEALDESSTPATDAFTVTVAGSGRTVTHVSVSGRVVTLTLASAVTDGQEVTVTYTVPGTNPLRDAAGNAAEGLSNDPVWNATPDATPPTISIVLSPGHGVPLNMAITATVTLDNLDPASYSSLVFRADLTEWEQAFARSTHCEGKDTGKDITVEVDASRETITVEVWKSCSQDIYAYFTLDAALFRLDTSAPGGRVELASAETRFAMSRYLQAGQTAPPPPAPGVAAWLDPDPTSFEWKVGESVVFRGRTDILRYLNHHLGVRGFGPEDGARFADDTDGLDAEEACRNVDDGIVDWRRAIHQPVRFFACRAGEAIIEVWHETEAERLSTYEFRVRPADDDEVAAPVITTTSPILVPENETAVATLNATDDTPSDQLTWTIPSGTNGGADADRFALSDAGALSFKAAKDYEIPDDADGDRTYEVTVQVSDGDNSVAADLLVTLENVLELTPLTGPAMVDYPENKALRVAAYIASSEEDREGLDWILSGADANRFSIGNPGGVLRFDIDPIAPDVFLQLPDFEDPADSNTDNVYSVTLAASDGTDTVTLDVSVTVGDENEAGTLSLDSPRPRFGEALTASVSDPDGDVSAITWKWERSAGRNAWVVIDGTTAASYTPTAADTGAYLRVTADYTDRRSIGQEVRAVAPNVVLAHALSRLEVTTSSSRSMYPSFEPEILHYAVGCPDGDTMTLTLSTDETDTRLAVNGIQRANRNVAVELTGLAGGSDIPITLTGSEGASTTYVLHCLADDFPAIITEKKPGAWDGLITIGVRAPVGSYLAIIDNNGVPRIHWRIEERVRIFRTHRDGRYPYSYGQAYSRNVIVLDENMEPVDKVTTVRPIHDTDLHDFVVKSNGNYLLLAYESARRDMSQFINSDNGEPYSTTELTRDSVIQEVTPDKEEAFNWNSWDHMAVEDCTQHRFPDDYAHVNSVQAFDDDIVASFRGCSKVLRIDGVSGDVIWRLGKSNRSDADWAASGNQPPLRIVGDPYGEFCGQHSARMIDNGNLLLFDNGVACLVDPEGNRTRPGEDFTRIVEYAIDPDHGEAVFRRHYSYHGEFNKLAQSQGHIEPLETGNWLISWGSMPVSEKVTEFNPLTGEEVLIIKLHELGDSDSGLRTTAYPVSSVALAKKVAPLTAEIVESPASSVFHLGPTDAPKVVVAFNQPVVDPDPAATTWPWVSVQGATVTSVSAHTVPGDPANAYLFTLTPAGVGPITFAPVAGQSCASGGICTADGTVLTVVPATAHTIAWVDTVAPALAATDAATVRGATLTLTFDEALASANTAASAFAVTGGTTRTISGVSVNGSTVQLTIDPPVLYGESGIEVDYTAPSRQALADAAGNKVASFEDRAVSNETPATTLSTGVSLSLDTASVSEGGSAKSVALTAMLNRSARPAATAVTVEVGTTGDTATEGTDYAAVDDLTLTIPAYMTGITVRFTLTPTNDRIDELGESLTVTGSTAVAGLIVTPPGGLALDIEDNDPAPSLALSVNASAIDEDGGTAAVTVSTGSGSTYATDQTVRLAVAGTATENADYTIGGKALTLPAGTGTSASMVTATVTGLDDNLDDDDETIEITGSRNGVAFGSRQTIAIEDDDWPVLTVTFRQADYRVAEGEHVDLPVTLSDVPERQVTIPIKIEVDGGAEAVDYSVSPASLTFGASETDKTVRVSAVNDSAVDLGESVALRFGTPLPERISEGGIAETTVAIRDTDFTFAPAFAAGSGTAESDADVYTVSEDSSALRLSLTLGTPRGARVADVADPVVVTLATRENAGGREADEDYATRRRSGTFGDYGELNLDLSFAPGDFSDDGNCGCATAEKAVSVDLFDDRVHERVEVFGLRLARESGRLSLSSKDVTIRIIEDDAEPALTLGADPGTIAEAGGTSTVTVSTGAGSTFPAAQTIRLDLSGTATRGSDYTIDSTSLTLPAGMGEDPSTVTTTVRALDDPFDDNAETVALSATLDGVEFARRTIGIDDDETGSIRVDLSVNPAQVREDAGATTVRVTATLDAAARAEDTDVAVTVGASGDSAVEGTDYATVPDLALTIDAGETTAETTFSLDPTNDSAVEGARTITVDGSAQGLAVRSADLTLNDDDVESTIVTLTLDPLEVGENAGSRAVRVTGTLDGGSRPTATVVAVTVGSGGDSAAEGEDYQDVGDLELTIPANRTDGTVTFTLRPTNDRTAEGTETISVRGDVAGLSVTSAELALADDDEPSTRLDLSLSPSTVSEAAAPTEVAVTGSLDAGARTSDTAVTVTVGASADSATEGLDYAYISVLAITVRANETVGQTTFTLSPENDAIAEGAETISVAGRASGLTVAPAALTLSDNDAASRVVTLAADPESVSEDTPEDVTVTASLDAGARAEDTGVRLTVGAAGDTAVPGTDYERVPERTLTILSGETGGTATFLLEPLDNDSADGARTLSVTGSTTVAELRIEPASGAKVALEDDDNPAVLVTPDTLTVVEAESDTYAVALQTRPTADVTVTITGVSGDLSLDRTSLVFAGADWSDPQDVEVTAADDDDSAQDAAVTLTHRASGAAEYRGLRAELVVSIRENDPSLVFSETALAVPEGQTATYTVALATVPTGDVTVRITGASGDLSLDKTRLAFTPGDWDDAQTITVEAAEDDDTSTDAAVTLTHEASGGGYDGVVGTVRATIREDDGDPRPPPPPPPGPGPGPSPPPSNRPPVATEEMTARILEVGDTVELDASEHFRDPDRRRMSFEAESADSAVATVEVDESAVTVRAVDHGVTAVTVTAVDDRRARATQSFEVTVGRLVSFASEEVAAAEGDTATLTVAISRPRDAATALDYVVGPDDDPATADADADDHDGMAGTVVIAAGATQATIAIAVRDDDDIEPPRETFAVTLRRSAEQARDFGLGVAAVRVRIDEGVCDRTPQVRNALRRSLPCARVSESDLAGVRTLDLSDAGLAALRPADFSGLRNLRALDMSGNSLASLPDGVFAGLGALSEARSQDNPGSPFVLRVELARTDGPASAPSPARLATRVRQGAPFPLRAGLRAVGGALSRDASLIATGMTESAPILVVREAAAGATRVELASTPLVPDTRCGRFGRYLCYRGFATAIGAPLVLFKDPPEVRGSVPATDLAAENDSIRISLSELFAAADGRPLRYAARSSDPGLAGAEVRGGVLIVVSGEDGREGTATITVTATDADGLSAALTFEVTLESMPRGFMRGWRRALIEQLIE